MLRLLLNAYDEIGLVMWTPEHHTHLPTSPNCYRKHFKDTICWTPFGWLGTLTVYQPSSPNSSTWPHLMLLWLNGLSPTAMRQNLVGNLPRRRVFIKTAKGNEMNKNRCSTSTYLFNVHKLLPVLCSLSPKINFWKLHILPARPLY